MRHRGSIVTRGKLKDVREVTVNVEGVWHTIYGNNRKTGRVKSLWPG